LGSARLDLLIGKAEVHLLFERIHFRDLHGQFIAQGDHAARAAADEISPRFIEHVEIVFNRGQRDESAHGQPGHIDKETKIPHIGHEGGIFDRRAGSELRFQEGEQFDVLAVALGIGGIAFGDGNMFGDFLQRTFL